MSNRKSAASSEMLDENSARIALPHVGFFNPDQASRISSPETRLLPARDADHLQRFPHRDAWRLRRGSRSDRRRHQLRHVLATQTVWLKKPKTFRINDRRRVAPAVTAKDVILSIIAQIGLGGAPATRGIRRLHHPRDSMEGR